MLGKPRLRFHGYRVRRDRDALSKERKALEKSGGHYLIGGKFTWADIAAAVAVQPACAVSDDYVRLGPAMRRSYASQDIADAFKRMSWHGVTVSTCGIGGPYRTMRWLS